MTKKLKPDEAIVKIKVYLDNYYSNIGREVDDADEARIKLIEKIDEVLSETSIPNKPLILQKLKEELGD